MSNSCEVSFTPHPPELFQNTTIEKPENNNKSMFEEAMRRLGVISEELMEPTGKESMLSPSEVRRRKLQKESREELLKCIHKEMEKMEKEQAVEASRLLQSRSQDTITIASLAKQRMRARQKCIEHTLNLAIEKKSSELVHIKTLQQYDQQLLQQKFDRLKDKKKMRQTQDSVIQKNNELQRNRQTRVKQRLAEEHTRKEQKLAANLNRSQEVNERRTSYMIQKHTNTRQRHQHTLVTVEANRRGIQQRRTETEKMNSTWERVNRCKAAAEDARQQRVDNIKSKHGEKIENARQRSNQINKNQKQQAIDKVVNNDVKFLKWKEGYGRAQESLEHTTLSNEQHRRTVFNNYKRITEENRNRCLTFNSLNDMFCEEQLNAIRENTENLQSNLSYSNIKKRQKGERARRMQTHRENLIRQKTEARQVKYRRLMDELDSCWCSLQQFGLDVRIESQKLRNATSCGTTPEVQLRKLRELLNKSNNELKSNSPRKETIDVVDSSYPFEGDDSITAAVTTTPMFEL